MPQGLPGWAVLERLEEAPIPLAWIDELVDRNTERHDQIDAAYLCATVAGGTLDSVNVAMNAVLCFIKNNLIDDPQQHTLTVLSALLGIDCDNGNEVSVAMLNDVGERLHRQGYVWTRAEAEGHFDKDQVSWLRQVAEHLKVLWHILNAAEAGEFQVRPNRGCDTYEYCSRFGGYVYHADGRLAKQNKTVTIGQQVRERNRQTPRSNQAEGQGEEKCGESEPIFTNHEGAVQIMALAGRSSCSRHEGKLLVPVQRPGRKEPESGFHKAAVRDSSGKFGPNPVGCRKWGQTLPAGSTSGHSALTAVEGSATKRTQTRDEGAQSLFVKRGKPNPVDIQAAYNNRLAQHKAKVQARSVKKNPRKRGLTELTWAAQRDLFRDMSLAEAKPMIEAIISKK